MPINYEAAKTLIKGLVQKMKSFRGRMTQLLMIILKIDHFIQSK